MKQINRRRFLLLFLSVLCMCGVTGCGGQVKEETKQVKNEIHIGFSFDSLSLRGGSVTGMCLFRRHRKTEQK